MNKKGFTLIELLGVIIILSILIGLAVLSYSKYTLKSRDKTFEISANSLEDAAKSAYSSCRNVVGKSKFCDTHNLDKITTEEKVYLSELIEYKYIEEVVDPYNNKELCDSDNSYVLVTRDNDDAKMEYTYKACLVCNGKTSKGCN